MMAFHGWVDTVQGIAFQRAAAVIPAQLDEPRKKERLRDLFAKLPAVPTTSAPSAADFARARRAGLAAVSSALCRDDQPL